MLLVIVYAASHARRALGDCVGAARAASGQSLLSYVWLRCVWARHKLCWANALNYMWPQVVCVLLAMRIWAQQELRRAKASEKWRQCQHTLSPEGGGTALHESHQSMPFAEGINIGGGTEELTQEHSTSGADQRERPLWSQASFKARGSGVGGGDG
eukprot:scaffold242_cov18-Tisochrysis_lutea.AAC.1